MWSTAFGKDQFWACTAQNNLKLLEHFNFFFYRHFFLDGNQRAFYYSSWIHEWFKNGTAPPLNWTPFPQESNNNFKSEKRVRREKEKNELERITKSFAKTQILISTATAWCDGLFLLCGPVNKFHINKTLFHAILVTEHEVEYRDLLCSPLAMQASLHYIQCTGILPPPSWLLLSVCTLNAFICPVLFNNFTL